MILLLISSTLPAMAAIIGGNPKGSVTLIEVYDYQCPHCRADYPAIQQLITNNADLKVRYMPVAILNEVSIYEAAAAISAANVNGGFEEFNALAMSGPVLNKTGVDNLLGQMGLTSPQFVASMHSQAVKQQMMEGLSFLKVEQSGTPLFIVYPTDNPKMSAVLKGEQEENELQEAINDAKNTRQ